MRADRRRASSRSCRDRSFAASAISPAAWRSSRLPSCCWRPPPTPAGRSGCPACLALAARLPRLLAALLATLLLPAGLLRSALAVLGLLRLLLPVALHLLGELLGLAPQLLLLLGQPLELTLQLLARHRGAGARQLALLLGELVLAPGQGLDALERVVLLVGVLPVGAAGGVAVLVVGLLLPQQLLVEQRRQILVAGAAAATAPAAALARHLTLGLLRRQLEQLVVGGHLVRHRVVRLERG